MQVSLEIQGLLFYSNLTDTLLLHSHITPTQLTPWPSSNLGSSVKKTKTNTTKTIGLTALKENDSFVSPYQTKLICKTIQLTVLIFILHTFSSIGITITGVCLKNEYLIFKLFRFSDKKLLKSNIFHQNLPIMYTILKNLNVLQTFFLPPEQKAVDLNFNSQYHYLGVLLNAVMFPVYFCIDQNLVC